MNPEHKRAVEALLFSSAEPLTREALAAHLPASVNIREIIEALVTDYESRGVHLVRIGNAWGFRSAPDLAPYLRHEVSERRKLSRAATETLAIIAYHQPCTRTDIEEIRGVAVSKGTLDVLLELGWIRLGPRREAPGRPVTFLTTDRFLDQFGLGDVKDLPGLKELRDAGLLDNRPVPEGLPKPAEED